MTASDISAQAADREKDRLLYRVPKHHWAYLVAAVIVACAIVIVKLMGMP